MIPADATATPPDTTPAPAPRLPPADRSRPLPPRYCYDDLLPDDHLARRLWDSVAGLDLTALYARSRATQGRPGRTPVDPRTLAALWRYAACDGVLSARYLAHPLAAEHRAYLWLAAGRPVNYHTLSDFRAGHADWLDGLLTDSVSVLLRQGLVELDAAAQDGPRRRAGAGAAAFHREQTLRECQQQAEAYLAELRRQERDDPGSTGRRHQARLRAARETAGRAAAALAELEELRRQRQQSDSPKQRAKEARASSTDPEARVMKMADGGFRPAYNGQLAVDAAHGVVLEVAVTNHGSDSQQLAPMLGRRHERYGHKPEKVLVDGGFTTVTALEKVAADHPEVAVYGPVKNAAKEVAAGRDPYRPKAGGSAAVAAWRQRMGTAAAQELYKKRGSSVAWANARARQGDLYGLRVRGQAKARAVLLWFAVAHSWRAGERLRAQAAAKAG